MENILIEFDDKVIELKELVTQLINYIGDKPVTRKVRDGFTAFYKNVDIYSKATETENVDQIAESAKHIAVYGQLISQGLSNDTDDQTKKLSSELLKKANEFRNFVENSPVEYKSLEIDSSITEKSDITSYNSIKRNLKKVSESHLEHDQRIKKLLNENEVHISGLSNRLQKIEGETQIELDRVSSLYKETMKELESKKNQINEILGHVSGRAIAGDFETSAADEKIMANWLRYASLGCMALIVAVVAYSFWETTSSDFQWQNSVFRMVLAIMLSVPAAYLARESAKHREQQYSHLQTSLDLKAISPYIASLPENEQHKIKVEVASRIFAAKDFSKVGSDPYPINVHEIVMELIKKIELPKQNSK